jgi:2-keto-4-pentenoate hydratase/2-oxohepta-3-ene-1,7-dioic acid hydratase in catechol pathway
MRLATFRGPGREPRVGVVIDGRVLDVGDVVASTPLSARAAEVLQLRGTALRDTGMLRLLAAGPEGLAAVQARVAAARADGSLDRAPRLAELELLAPVPRPGKIVAVGRNYGEHAKESGGAAQEKPRIISKLPSSVIPPGGTVPAGPVAKLDFEVELAVVIGAFAKDVPRARAFEVVAGYTVLDDVSAREFQFDVSPPQTTFAKSLDGYCPMGPWLVTKDEVPDPQALELSCRLNGAVMQHASTAEMIFPIDELIAYVTRFMTLEPGDVIATGTPSGVGAFRTPPVWLKAGDRLRLEVERVGVLEHDIG